MIIRRTFAALQHPKGSPERKRLNLSPATSEYHPKQKFVFISTGWGSQLAETLEEAWEMKQNYLRAQ